MRWSKTRTRSARSRREREGGFTLIEVVIALSIVAVTAVVLLDRRIAIVQETIHSREVRMLWVLASQKIAELELDPLLWTGEGGSSSGDFSELDPALAEYTYEYTIQKRDVPTHDPSKQNEKPKEIYRLAFQIRGPELDTPVLIEAEFPLEAPKGEAPASGASGATPDGRPAGTPAPAPAPPPAFPPPPGGPK